MKRTTIAETRCITYELKVSYIDDTYWDDGSRHTNDTETFATRREMFDRLKELVKLKKYRATSKVTGETKDFQIESMTWVVTKIDRTSQSIL